MMPVSNTKSRLARVRRFGEMLATRTGRSVRSLDDLHDSRYPT